MREKIKQNLLQIQEEIVPCKPKIIAVTKYFDKNAIIDAYQSGVRDFAESRVVEAAEKIESLPGEIIKNSQFHFIGHLQTNKVKKAIEYFDYIHSVDSVKLAQKISQHCQEIGKVQKVLLQVNNADEEQKYGFRTSEINKAYSQIKDLASIKVVGIMNIAPLGEDEDRLKELYKQIRLIRDDLENTFGCKLEELSMGMSQDYKIAAYEGATMLRVGRKLFK